MSPRMKNNKSAYWIGVPNDAFSELGIQRNPEMTETAYFRTCFNLAQAGVLKVKISANSRYRLWVNGKPVGSGPCKGDKWRQYYEAIDLTEYLKTGYNIIAAKVVSYPAYEAKAPVNYGPFSVMSNGAGPYLMLEGMCKTSKGKLLADISTGYSEWLVTPDKAVKWVPYQGTSWIGAMEESEGGLVPYGWKDQQEAEGRWFPAETKWLAAGDPSETPYGLIPPLPLEERPIPLLYEKPRYFKKGAPVYATELESIAFPSFQGGSVTLKPDTKYGVVLDAGELTTGYFILKTNDGEGSTIKIRYAEGYSVKTDSGFAKGIRDDIFSGVIVGHEDVYHPSGREDTYEPFWFRTFRFVQLEIETGMSPLTIEAPMYLETGYPLEVKSSVSSSEGWVNDVWDISLRTLKRCMHETYEDCPYYEQLQYAMDTRSQILFTYMVSGDTKLAEKAMYDYHSSLMPNGLLQSRYPSKQPQVIPTFSIYFIMMVEDYYWQTGETEHIRKYRATIDAVLEWFNNKVGEHGLIEDLDFWPFIDWVDGWEHGVPPASAKGPSTVHNLLYVAGLQVAARLNELTGRKHIATEYEKRARDIMQLIESACWSDKHGLFKDAPKWPDFSQHAQVWAVITGLAKGKRAKSILKKCFAIDDIAVCSYSMRFYLLRALEMANMYDRSESIWDDWKNMLKQNLTTCPEDSVNMRSDCHGWSALPLYEFTTCILGVTPLQPGWERIQIQPQCLSIPDFSGSVVTPKGMVHVTWKEKGGHFSITGQVPEGIPFELLLPDGTKQLYLHGGSFEF